MEVPPSEVHRGSLLERRSSEELRRLLDRAFAASSNGIVITDSKLPDDPIVYVNRAFEQYREGSSRDDLAVLVLRVPE